MRRHVVVLVCLIVYGMSSMLIMMGDRSPLHGGPSANVYTTHSKLNLNGDPTIAFRLGDRRMKNEQVNTKDVKGEAGQKEILPQDEENSKRQDANQNREDSSNQVRKIEEDIQKQRREDHQRKCFQWVEDINRDSLGTLTTINFNLGEDPSLPSVTLSFTVTGSEWWRIPTQIPHLIHNSQYLFTQIVVYIDNTPSSDSCASPAHPLNTHDNNSLINQELARELHILKSIGWIDGVRLIETDPPKYVPILAKVFKSDCPAIDLRMPKKGVVSFVQPLEDCKTTYCAHLNLGKLLGRSFFTIVVYLSSVIALDFALFKKPGVDYSWIAEGIKVLQNPSVVMVSPAGGPQLEGITRTHSLLSSR